MRQQTCKPFARQNKNKQNGFGICYHFAIKQEMRSSKSECFQGFSAPHVHFFLISLNCDDGIEYSACLREPTPQELLDRMELFIHLWNALNSLPEVQGVRVEAHLILGKSYRQIAREQGVDKSAVRHSVKSGKAAMRKYLKKFL